MRPPDSVSGTRWTRWTPLSNFRRDQAPSPSIVKQISFTPPSSVSLTESTSTFQRRASAYMEYMRYREWANRAASSPPTPARISTMTFFPSLGSRGSSRTWISSSSRARSALACGVLLLGQLLHIRVGHEGLAHRPGPACGAAIGPVGRDHRLQLPLLLVQPRHQVRVLLSVSFAASWASIWLYLASTAASFVLHRRLSFLHFRLFSAHRSSRKDFTRASGSRRYIFNRDGRVAGRRGQSGRLLKPRPLGPASVPWPDWRSVGDHQQLPRDKSVPASRRQSMV